MFIGKTQNYLHLFTKKKGEIFKPEPLLVVGASRTGKSILEEDYCEEIEEKMKNIVSLFLFDAGDELESAFAMFPATDKEQVKKLEKQLEKPEPKKVKLHVIYSKVGLKEWADKNKKRFKDSRLPEADIFTISLKSLGREEIQFLLEDMGETKSVRLFKKAVDSLRNDGDINELKEKLKGFSTAQKDIEYLDSSIGDKSDYRDVSGCLELFEQDGFLMPNSCPLNLDMKKILSEPNTRHVFIYKALKQDEKLRHFVFFHILNEIKRYASESIYFTIVVIEEAQTLCPFKGKGYFQIMEQNVGDFLGRIGKRGKGFTPMFVAIVWSGTAEMVRSKCKKQVLFYIEQDDVLKYIKARSLGKKEKNIMVKLEVGQCILRGYEKKVIDCNVPKHGHKHHYQNFMEEYRKFYPEKLTDYSELVKDVEIKRKEGDSAYGVREKKDIEKKKKQIRFAMQKKMSKDKGVEELKKMKDEAKKDRELDKQKRDEAVVMVYNELKARGEKCSYRIIAKKVVSIGHKCSHEQVRIVLGKIDEDDTKDDIEDDIEADKKKDEFKDSLEKLKGNE